MARGWSRPGPTASSCSTASSSRTSTSDQLVGPNLVLSTRDELRCRCAGSPSSAASSDVAGGDQRHPHRRGRDQAAPGRGRRDDAGLGLCARPGPSPDHARGVRAWLEEKEYQSVEQMKGSLSQENSADPSAFERSNYIKTLTTFIGPAIWGRADHPEQDVARAPQTNFGGSAAGGSRTMAVTAPSASTTGEHDKTRARGGRPSPGPGQGEHPFRWVGRCDDLEPDLAYQVG